MDTGTIIIWVLIAVLAIIQAYHMDKLRQKIEKMNKAFTRIYNRIDDICTGYKTEIWEVLKKIDSVNSVQNSYTPDNNVNAPRTFSDVTPELLMAYGVSSVGELPKSIRDSLPEDVVAENKNMNDLLGGDIEYGTERI